MKKKKLEFKSFIFILLALWIVSDIVLTAIDPLKYSPHFVRNDYDVTQLEHREKVWDKVLFGSSVVTASYLESESKSGFYNVGVDYGTVSDIYNMIKKNEIKIGTELVIALNDISFLDSLDTNHTYIWHKKWYQHYLFFERDKIYPLFEVGIINLINGRFPLNPPAYGDTKKTVYYGQLTDEELEKSNQGMIERFGGYTISDCEKNYNDLEKLIKLCEKKNIRLRAIWMPWNPKVPIYDFAHKTMEEANRIFAENGIEVYDMTNLLEPEYFYDIGHTNYELGAARFTELADEFLCK